MKQINKVDYMRHPKSIPDTDDGNMRLYYELELLRSSYESSKCSTQLNRYIQIIDVLGERGLFVDFGSDLEIDKATRRSDWYEPLMKPIPSPGKDEEQSAFISRCMGVIGGEYEDKKQAVAICHDSWRKAKKKSDDIIPVLPVEKKPEIHIHLDDDEDKQLDLEYKRERLQLIRALKEKAKV